MIAQCSTCGKTFEIRSRGTQHCPHCGTHVYIEGPSGQPGDFPSTPDGANEAGGPRGPSDPPGQSDPGDYPGPEGSYGWGASTLPGGGPEGERGRHADGPTGNPFDRREELGFLGAFFATLKLALFDPARLFRGMRTDHTDGAFLFGWLCTTIGFVFSGFWNFLSTLAPTPTAEPPTFEGLPPELQDFLESVLAGTSESATIAASIVFAPLFAAVGLLISALLVHLGAIILGANNRGWNASFRAVCYGSAAWLAGVVPFCGAIIANVWVVVLTIVGVYYLHRTTPTRAAFAVLIWFIFCCCCFCIGGFALVGSAASILGAAGGG